MAASVQSPADVVNLAADPRGTHIKFEKGDGVHSIVEIGLKPGDARAGSATEAAEQGERIEKYAAGLWRYSARVADQLDSNPDGSSVYRPSWGWYALSERTLYQGSGGSDLAGFLRVSGTDGDSTAIKTAVNIGIRAKAMLPGRGEDVFGLAYTRAALSGKWRSLQATLGTPTSTFEDAWEATYRIQAGKWLALQPVIQRINHPGGNASRDSSNIVGLRVDMTF